MTVLQFLTFFNNLVMLLFPREVSNTFHIICLQNSCKNQAWNYSYPVWLQGTKQVCKAFIKPP